MRADGAQTVAPKSINACAKSPGRPSGTKRPRQRRARRFGCGSGSRNAEQARQHPLGIAVYRGSAAR
jgi:hypothetical protein